MATARTLSLGWQSSATWRNFGAAITLAVATLAVGGVIYLVETYGLRCRHRFVENPSDVMMRAFGLAHFWIGWLFLFTSPRLRTPSALGKLGTLTLLGAIFCFASWAYGGMKNPLLLMAYYAYFLNHEIRDQANLFVAYGDAPADRGRDLFLNRLATCATLFLMTAFACVYMGHGRVQEKMERIVAEPALWLPALAGALMFAWGISAWMVRSCVRQHGIVLRDYAPLLAVYVTITAVLIFGSILGSVGFNLIVLIHVMAWFVFVQQRLTNQPQTPRSLWSWLRTTPAGFVTLHLAAVAVVLVLMALRVHLWERAGFVSQLFSTSSFHYWTIMHITMAMWRK